MSDGTHLTTELRRRAVDAVIDGMTRAAVASAYGVDRKTVTRWVNKFHDGGEEALLRKAGSGRRRLLEDLTVDELQKIVLAGAIAYGFETDLWTANRLRRVITDEFGVRLSRNTIWRRLRDAGLTYQKPEREYYEIDEAARKKWLRYEGAEDSASDQETSRNPLFPGRIQHFLDGLFGKDVGPAWANPQSKGDRQASGSCRNLGRQSPWASAVSIAR